MVGPYLGQGHPSFTGIFAKSYRCRSVKVRRDYFERFDLQSFSGDYLKIFLFSKSHIRQHRALLKTCEESLEASHGGGQTPCLLVFFTHHRPWLVKEDLAFFELARAQGWNTEKIVHRKMEVRNLLCIVKPVPKSARQAMFKDDPGDEDIRSAVEGWRVWR